MAKLKTRIPLTPLQRKILALLSYVTFLPGSGDKKFYKSIKDDIWLTEKQIAFMLKIFDKYRRQIPDYESLAMQLEPERISVKVSFENTLFGAEPKIEIKDTHTNKERWTKKDRISHGGW